MMKTHNAFIYLKIFTCVIVPPQRTFYLHYLFCGIRLFHSLLNEQMISEMMIQSFHIPFRFMLVQLPAYSKQLIVRIEHPLGWRCLMLATI